MNTNPMKPDPSREETLFSAAAEITSPDARAAYLDRECAGDAVLRARVEALLRAAGDTASPLDAPPAAAGPTGTLVTPVLEKPGDKIGHYKLLQQIGEGGCGVVYMAEQEEPVKRRVALKVIKLGMDTRQVVARFEAERQALAMMDHTNIAKVFDAGATDTGRPFFVMELVRGTKITEFADQQKLSTRERLDLFMDVCSAIQHAHQKGIIHRDLKPSNVLVTMIDGKPVPKVIDFGIAKATNQQRLTDKTLFTAFEQFIGTPAYMSPEQAEMSGVDIDTRSDIYSLGVLLYELLTGSTPFDAEQLINSGLDGIRRTLKEQEPIKPSTRLNTLANADLNTVAAQRHTEAPKLVHNVRGDLDWVVMKCLEKDRARRYESASGLAADLRRHLDSQPIVARPPSAAYLLQKMARRHRLAFTAGTAVVAALVIGVSVAAISLLRERETFRAWEDAAQAAHRGWKRAYTALRETEASKTKAETALTQAKAGQTALFYWQAFESLPSQTNKNIETVAAGHEEKLDLDKMIELAPKYDRALHLLHKAASLKSGCDWAVDWSEGPDVRGADFSSIRHLTAAARLRARIALAQGRVDAAVQDLLAAFILGRNGASNGALVNVAVQFRFTECGTVSLVGEQFYQFTPASLLLLLQGIETAPPHISLSQGIDAERTANAEWLLGKVDDARPVSENLRIFLGNESIPGSDTNMNDFIRMASGSNAQLKEYISQVLPFYDLQKDLSVVPPEKLEAEDDRIRKLVESSPNWFVKMTFANVGGARRREVEAVTRLAMLKAAVAYKQSGLTGLNSVRDPFGDGPFELRPVERGFELHSKIEKYGWKGGQLFAEKAPGSTSNSAQK